MNNPGESVRQNGGRQTSFHGLKIKPRWDFPGGPGVKNPPCYAEDTGWIPGQGTKIHMPWKSQACMLQLLKPELEATMSGPVRLQGRSHTSQPSPDAAK